MTWTFSLVNVKPSVSIEVYEIVGGNEVGEMVRFCELF